MVSKVIACYHCGGTRLVKNGTAPNGKQKYQCRDCGKASRENPDYGYSDERKEEIIRAYQERPSLRGLTRTFGVSRNTVTKWLKKSQDTASTE